MAGLVNASTTGNPFLGGKLLGTSIGRSSGALKGFGNPFLGDTLLGTSIGRASGL